MRAVHYFLLFFFSLTSVNAFSQKVLNEGTLAYTISIASVKGEKPVAGALNGAALNIFLTKDKSRTSMTSTPGTETTVYDAAAGKGFILKEYSAQKLMITFNEDNMLQKNHVNSSLVFSTGSGTETINGYPCKKAVAQTADGKVYTVYFDPSVLIANKTYNNAFPQLGGLPVRYELQSGNLIFKYDLTKYTTESISAVQFDSPKTGFRVMSFEENQQLKKE